MSRTSRASAALQRRADGPAGLAAAFGWAFAEALVWPVIPDAAVALLVTARPRRWPVLTTAAVTGTVLGGWPGSSGGRPGCAGPCR